VSAQSEQSRPDSVEAEIRPIELVTENGFAVLRSWEIDGLPRPAGGSYLFIVRNPQNRQKGITVETSPEVVQQVEFQTRGRILLSSSFWICCAERQLANYLWQNDDYPPGERLWVERLTPDELITAIRWKSA
jgi:hypothetical protein